MIEKSIGFHDVCNSRTVCDTISNNGSDEQTIQRPHIERVEPLHIALQAQLVPEEGDSQPMVSLGAWLYGAANVNTNSHWLTKKRKTRLRVCCRSPFRTFHNSRMSIAGKMVLDGAVSLKYVCLSSTTIIDNRNLQ
jgi:hypothetical protein